MRKTSFGFTMIEILVVVAVIGILSTIGVVAFTKVQTDSRDSQRSSRVTVISEALEKYYQQNGEYPSCAQMKQDPSIIKSSVLKGIDTSVLVTPTDKTNDNSITTCDNLTSGPGSDVYAYVGDGSPDCMTGSSCLSYSLKYREESTGDIVSVDSRHSADITTSGAPVLSATPTSFSQIALSWSAVQNAASYTIERHSGASSCTTGTTTSHNSTTNSYSDTGLTSGTSYYYRVQALDSNGLPGVWSNCINSTTLALSGIQLIASSVSNSQIDLQWNRDPSASSYDIDYSTDSNFGTFTPIHAIPQEAGSTISRSVTGLTTGIQYYFRGQSVSGSVHGPWSYDNAVTYVPAPTSITATTNSSTQITASWSNVSVATSYNLDYSTTSNFTGATTNTITGISGTSRAVTGLTQGKTYYFKSYAVVGSTPSAASPTATATTTVNTPGAPGMAASQPGAIRTCAAGYWVKYPQYCPNNYYATGWVTSASCPSGTYAVYQLYARYNSPTTAYYSSASTASQWYFEAASGGYYTLWGGRYYCQGPNAASSWGPWSGEARS
ncbi:MAG TPA: prepilin-type N-terminal cleavage/methylation domain-containing protein [Candidatus Saccharibacteria bacterium]|mgnify:CR=1 FL=1|nr:prepilin-type N-terminal cleavage/methylation domain-containing protein [Candidatus Saccharibacteria bacterium]HRQ06776.1 prepilin-type N-terminal cleavage/methylation domain-containing protein [Candidatus Saccharibacteria bacterium]